MVKRLPTMREIQVQSLGREDLLEKEMATHSSILFFFFHLFLLVGGQPFHNIAVGFVIHSHESTIHSSILAWKIPWTEEPGRLQSMGKQRIGHD